jgi:hypothetical protein
LLIPGVKLPPEKKGRYDRFSHVLTPDQIEQMKNAPIPVHPFFVTIVEGLIDGITINAVAGFGDEPDWRGLMLRELSYLAVLHPIILKFFKSTGNPIVLSYCNRGFNLIKNRSYYHD